MIKFISINFRLVNMKFELGNTKLFKLYTVQPITIVSDFNFLCAHKLKFAEFYGNLQ